MSQHRYLIFFIIIMLSIGINLGQHILDRLNVDRNILLITLIAIVIAGLLAQRHLLFITLVGGLTVAINLPAEILNQNHVSPDMLFATLVAVIITPFASSLVH
jgi:hypothetical protein